MDIFFGTFQFDLFVVLEYIRYALTAVQQVTSVGASVSIDHRPVVTSDVGRNTLSVPTSELDVGRRTVPAFVGFWIDTHAV